MKKNVFAVIVGLLISVSTIAQSTQETRIKERAREAVEKVIKTIELSEDEQQKYYELHVVKLTNRSKFPKGLKKNDPDTFKEKTRENREKFEKYVLYTFGPFRGKSILEAGKAGKAGKAAKGKGKRKGKGKGKKEEE